MSLRLIRKISRRNLRLRKRISRRSLRLRRRISRKSLKLKRRISYLLSAASETLVSLGKLYTGRTNPIPKLVGIWKDIFNVWINHVLSLVSSTMSDKKLVGINLLRITCVE